MWIALRVPVLSLIISAVGFGLSVILMVSGRWGHGGPLNWVAMSSLLLAIPSVLFGFVAVCFVIWRFFAIAVFGKRYES